jgi:predicted benzoate:H+ symporter BenE
MRVSIPVSAFVAAIVGFGGTLALIIAAADAVGATRSMRSPIWYLRPSVPRSSPSSPFCRKASFVLVAGLALMAALATHWRSRSGTKASAWRRP